MNWGAKEVTRGFIVIIFIEKLFQLITELNEIVMQTFGIQLLL
jgi:hypothetical protein